MAVEVISFIPEVLVNGSAYNFRTSLNTNFQNIKISIDSIKLGMEGIGDNIDGIKNDITNINNDIKDINDTLSGGVGGTNIVCDIVQPTGQKKGDYWFHVLDESEGWSQ